MAALEGQMAKLTSAMEATVAIGCLQHGLGYLLPTEGQRKAFNLPDKTSTAMGRQVWCSDATPEQVAPDTSAEAQELDSLTRP